MSESSAAGQATGGSGTWTLGRVLRIYAMFMGVAFLLGMCMLPVSCLLSGHSDKPSGGASSPSSEKEFLEAIDGHWYNSHGWECKFKRNNSGGLNYITDDGELWGFDVALHGDTLKLTNGKRLRMKMKDGKLDANTETLPKGNHEIKWIDKSTLEVEMPWSTRGRYTRVSVNK